MLLFGAASWRGIRIKTERTVHVGSGLCGYAYDRAFAISYPSGSVYGECLADFDMIEEWCSG